jgi:sugar phosphate permease
MHFIDDQNNRLSLGLCLFHQEVAQLWAPLLGTASLALSTIRMAGVPGDGKATAQLLTLNEPTNLLLLCFIYRGYLIFGVITVFLGIVVFFLLIDKPTSKLLRLNEQEKKIMDLRVTDNMVVKSKKIKREQIWEALKEPRLYCLCFSILFLNLQNGGLISFSVLLVQSLGFDVSSIKVGSWRIY